MPAVLSADLSAAALRRDERSGIGGGVEVGKT